MALLVLEQHVLAICMVGDAMGVILWVMPCSVSQAPMARAPTLPPIAYAGEWCACVAKMIVPLTGGPPRCHLHSKVIAIALICSMD